MPVQITHSENCTTYTGTNDDFIELARERVAMDPFDDPSRKFLALSLFAGRQFAEAAVEASRVFVTEPPSELALPLESERDPRREIAEATKRQIR